MPRGRAPRVRRASTFLRAEAAVLAAMLSLTSCTSDDGGGGERCEAPGTTRLCTCAVAELGRQPCLDTGYWGDCDCPGNPAAVCVSGGPSPCAGCPDAPAVCNDVGGFDCSCEGDGGSDAATEAPDSGSSDARIDASTDSGREDAATHGDAGDDDAG